MNFLSHYYFDRYALDSHQVLGGLLPDLLKNIDKKYSFQLHKFEDQLEFSPHAIALTVGWKRHVEVDRIFHNTDFFYSHTHQLRKALVPVVEDLPVRASFLAHIALELLLDHLLMEKQLLSVSRLYEHLENVDKTVLKSYLKVFGGIDEDQFFIFYDRFVASKYIFKYAEIGNISHTLFNICKRIWTFEVSATHLEALTVILERYQRDNLKNYLDIYAQIQQQLD